MLEEYSSQPIVDKRNLLQWVVFNYLIGNCDAHAKNISILFLKGKVRLAPFYDLMSTMIYPELSRKLAMKVGGENRSAWIMKRHWQRLAQAANVGDKAIIGIYKNMGEKLSKAAESLAKTFEKNTQATKTILKIRQHISKMSDTLRAI